MEDTPLAKASVVMTIVGILILMILTWFIFIGAGEADFLAKTEDDLQDMEGGNYTLKINAFLGSSITVSVDSATDDEVWVEVSIYDPDGDLIEMDDGKTPILLTADTMMIGDHEIVIHLNEEDKDVEDIEVKVSSQTALGLLMGLSGFCLLPVSASFVITAMIMAAVVLNRRASRIRREKEIRMDGGIPISVTSDISNRGPSPYNYAYPPYGNQFQYRYPPNASQQQYGHPPPYGYDPGYGYPPDISQQQYGYPPQYNRNSNYGPYPYSINQNDGNINMAARNGPPGYGDHKGGGI